MKLLRQGQDRHYDRAVRQLQQRLRKPDEAMGEITQQLFPAGVRSGNAASCLAAAGASVVSVLDTRRNAAACPECKMIYC